MGRPVVVRRSRIVRRVMYALFFDNHRFVARASVLKYGSVTGSFTRNNVLTHVVTNYLTKRPRTGVRDVKLLRNSAPAHRSTLVKVYLSEQEIEILPHYAYSPYLLPCEFA